MNSTIDPLRPGRSRLSGLKTYLGGGASCVRIIMFHGIGGSGFSADAFERQLRYFVHAFDVVSIDRALDALASDRAARRPKLTLTFDDGLRNHHDVAYPILARLKLPAVFYVCPGLIDSARWLWPHEARQRLRSLQPEALQRLALHLDCPALTADAMVSWMKGLPADRVQVVLQDIRNATPQFAPSSEQRHQFDVMSWEELGALDPAIVTVGSHTVSHPIMTGLPAAALEYEVRHSRTWLEDRLQRPVQHFCYPNGSANAAVRKAVSLHHSSAVMTDRGYAHPGADRLTLPRIHATPERARMTFNLHRTYPGGK